MTYFKRESKAAKLRMPADFDGEVRSSIGCGG